MNGLNFYCILVSGFGVFKDYVLLKCYRSKTCTLQHFVSLYFHRFEVKRGLCIRGCGKQEKPSEVWWNNSAALSFQILSWKSCLVRDNYSCLRDRIKSMAIYSSSWMADLPRFLLKICHILPWQKCSSSAFCCCKNCAAVSGNICD